MLMPHNINCLKRYCLENQKIAKIYFAVNFTSGNKEHIYVLAWSKIKAKWE